MRGIDKHRMAYRQAVEEGAINEDGVALHEQDMEDIFGDDIPSVGATYTDKPTVTAVQTALAAKGYSPGKIDGVYGPNTAAGIRAMQTAAGTPVTGTIDYGVLMALGVPAPGTAASFVAKGEAAALQSASATAQVDALKNQLDAAQKELASAKTAQQQQAASKKVEVLTQAVTAAEPSFFMQNVPGVNLPFWQVAIAGIGLAAVGFGAYSMMGKRR